MRGMTPTRRPSASVTASGSGDSITFCAWADSWNVGLAGLLLLGSLCFRGNLMGLLVIVGAGLVVAGHHLGIRTVEPLREAHVGLLLGTVVAFIGFRTGTR